MSNYVVINKIIKKFNREIRVSSDKSISIRSVLIASQAVGTSKISNLLESEDVMNALKTIKKLGINYKKIDNTYEIYGFGLNGFNLKKKNDNKCRKFRNIGKAYSWIISQIKISSQTYW